MFGVLLSTARLFQRIIRKQQVNWVLSPVCAYGKSCRSFNLLRVNSRKAIKYWRSILAAGIFTGVDTRGLFSKLGRVVFSEEFEADADYMGLYLAARSGYDIKTSPDFWRRIAVEHPGNIRNNMLATHPSTPERAVSLQKSIAEIEAKRDDGRPLTPEFK
jgi:hypothetical protein